MLTIIFIHVLIQNKCINISCPICTVKWSHDKAFQALVMIINFDIGLTGVSLINQHIINISKIPLK